MNSYLTIENKYNDRVSCLDVSEKP